MKPGTAFRGVYDIRIDPEKYATLQLPKISVSSGLEKVKLSTKGEITTYATTHERLVGLKLAAIVAMKRASGWKSFRVFQETEYEVRGKTGTMTSTVPLTILVRHPTFDVDATSFRKTLKNTMHVTSDSLLFVVRATELQGERGELAVLTAMLGLELELGRIVPYKEFRRTSAKIGLLAFQGLLKDKPLARIRSLFKLRNALAHGNWNSAEIGDRLNDLLEGRKRWLTNDGRMTHEASGRIIEEIITSLAEIEACRSQLAKKSV